MEKVPLYYEADRAPRLKPGALHVKKSNLFTPPPFETKEP